MNIIAWNIQHGGGQRVEAIAAELARRDADVVVLGEFQVGRTELLLRLLGEAGLKHAVITDPPGQFGGLAIASRHALEPRTLSTEMTPFAFRYQAVGIAALNLELRAVYAPLHKDPYNEFWSSMLRDLAAESHEPVLVCGDFNAGASGLDSPAPNVFCAKYFSQLPASGYKDLWRQMHGGEAREHTWHGRTYPYRLDHAFGSATVAQRLRGCVYDHGVRERKLSDHSLLSIDLAGLPSGQD